MYRSHAERIWAAEKWRQQEEEKIRQEKLAKQKGILGKFLNAAGKENEEQVELTEEDLSTEALIERAARQKPPIEKPVLKDSHRLREARERELKGTQQHPKLDDADRKKP